MILTFQAGPGERFAPDAFASQVGQRVPITVRDQVGLEATLATYREGLVTEARVSADGSEAALTFKVEY